MVAEMTPASVWTYCTSITTSVALNSTLLEASEASRSRTVSVASLTWAG